MLRRTVLTLTVALACPAVRAQELPDRPIRLVVPTGAGGITDLLARIIAQHLARRIGQPVVVDNRPGASGVIGTEAVVRSRPDGTTLLMVYPSHPVNPALKARLPYDTERDLTPISMVSTVALVLLVPKESPDRTVTDLLARARRERLAYASVGAGSLAHLANALFCSMAGVEMLHIPFRSAPEAHAAVMRGEVAMFLDPPITTLPLLQGDKVRGLAVSTRDRLPALPQLPTIAEAGLPGYEVTGWNGLLAPAGTPPALVQRYAREVRAILDDETVRAELARHGTDVAPMTPEQFAAIIHADIEKWARVVRDAGISPD
jgi:tripartite-type tricarboxylate transporter receptor subunit TctC